MRINIEYCSLYYLRQWLSSERDLHYALNCKDKAILRKGLAEAVQFFGVARNLPRIFDIGRGLTRHEPLFTSFLKLNEQDVTESNYIDIFDSFLSSLASRYGDKTLISLSSKLLWLRFRDPFIIYDSRVRSSLNIHSSDYSICVRKWLEAFRPYQEEIAEISSKLPSLLRYVDFGIDGESRREIKNISSKEWFHRRVFDMCLWHLSDLKQTGT
jgi:hypothetical protein